MNQSALLLTAVLFAALATPAHACQCPMPSPGAAIGSARLIFAARIAGKRGPTGFPVRVLAVWKGDIPESTTVRGTGVCGYGFEPATDVLVYMHSASDSAAHAVNMCSGTRQLESAYLDRYLLGEPVFRYDDSYRPVTLDSMLDLIRQPGGEVFAPHFSDFRVESPLLLPALRRTARGEMLGNKLGAVLAIDQLGSAAADAYPDLCVLFEYLSKQDPELRAAALSAMLSVNRDYQQNRAYILKAMDDDAAAVRAVVVRRIYDLSNRDQEEVRQIVWRGFSDESSAIRASAIRGSSYSDLSDATARRVKHVSRSDSNEEVLDATTAYFEAREKHGHRQPSRTRR